MDEGFQEYMNARHAFISRRYEEDPLFRQIIDSGGPVGIQMLEALWARRYWFAANQKKSD